MKRLQVSSSNINAIGWEPGTAAGFDDSYLQSGGILEVEFTNGAVYRYGGVPLVTAFMVAVGAIDGSVGRTFHRLVRSQPFTYTRINP